MANIKISALPLASLPLDLPNTLFEVQTFEAGIEVSRKVTAEELVGSISGLDATFITVNANASLPNERILTEGQFISIADAGAGNPITISVSAALAWANLSDVDIEQAQTGSFIYSIDGTDWEDTGGGLLWDDIAGELLNLFTYVALGGIALRNANGDCFIDNVLLGGGQFQYTVSVAGNDFVRLRDDGLASFGQSGGSQNTTLQSGVEVDIVRNGVDQVALTLAPAAGGLSVNNTLTGAGLERVLTIGDIGAGNPFATSLGILGDINTATPPTTEAITADLELRDLQNVNVIGSFGFDASNTLDLKNLMRGGELLFSATDAGGAEAFAYFFDPAASFWLRHGATQEIVIFSQSVSAGGVLVANGVTGAGGNSRVRTASDKGAKEIEFNFDTNTDTGSDPGSQDFRMNNVNPALVTEIAVADQSIALQTEFDLFWGAELVSGDKLFIVQPNSQDNWAQYELTGPPVDQTGWWNFPVSLIANGTIFDTTRLCRFSFSLASLAAGGGSASQLVDGSANVAVIAEGSGTSAIRSVGNIDAEGRELEWQLANGTTRFSIGNEFFTDMILRNHIAGRHVIINVGTGGGTRIRAHFSGDAANGGVTLYAGTSATGRLATSNEGVRIQNGTLFLAEQAAQESDDTGFGQLFVDSADDALHYITEVGVDFNLSAGVFDPTLDQTISGHWEFTDVQGVDFGPSCELDLRNNADDSSVFIQNLGPIFQFGIAGGDFGDGVFQISQSSFARVECPVIFIGEQAASEADIAGDGQIWVESLVPNTLMFTDDSGTEMRVSTVQWFNNFGGQQQVNNSTTPVVITQLSGFQLDANSVYHIEIFLKVNQASATPDLLLRLNPQGAGTLSDEVFQITSIAATGVFTFQDTNVHTVLGAIQNATGNHTVHIIGTVDVGNGDLWDLEFAQQIATAANTIIDDASYVKVTKIGPGP